jgi:hypothetical protein
VYNDDVLGYYPGHLFTMLNGGACGSAWYAEAYKPPDKPGVPALKGEIEMGSGLHGSAGALRAAYVRNPKYYEPIFWSGLEPKDDSVTKTMWMSPYNPECYSRTDLTNGRFYLGGDGSKSTYCLWPKSP